MLSPSAPWGRPVAAKASAPVLLVLLLWLFGPAATGPASARAEEGGEPRAWRIPVEGVINGDLVEQTQRRVRQARRAGANLLIFELSCGGGRLDKAHELGVYFAQLGIETVAYVTTRASDLALLLALGCSRIDVQKEADGGPAAEDAPPREAKLGGFGPYLDKHPHLEALRRRMDRSPAERQSTQKQELARRRQALEDELRDKLFDLAKTYHRPKAILLGTCKSEVHVVEVKRSGEPGRIFLTEEEFDADQKGPRLYTLVQKVKPWRGEAKYENRYLTLSPEQAREVGLASAVVKDFDDLCLTLGVPASEVRLPEPDWLDSLAGFLEHPVVSAVLVLIGLTCLLLEFQTRGVGLPGAVAAGCFVLFLWAHSRFSGRVEWLALAFLALSLALLAVEVFVRPGKRLCGVGGILLLLASLGLAAYGHLPAAAADWLDFGCKLLPVAVGTAGSLVGSYFLVKHLSRFPMLNRLVGRTWEEVAEQAAVEIPEEHRRLLGATGFAATTLRPAGKAQFEKAFVDVVAEGGEVLPGTRVQVVRLEANRLVVKVV